MGVPDKLAAQATKLLGEQVVAAAMVVPPGATLYKSFSPNSSAVAAAGPLIAAFMSKSEQADEGSDASTVPRQQGVLVLTADRAVYCKKKLFGVGVGDQITDWPRASLGFTFESNAKWSYPGLLIEFADASSCVVFGEKKWGLDAIAAAT